MLTCLEPRPGPATVDVDVGLPAGKIWMHPRTVFFLCELTDLSHCISLKAIVKVSYATTLLFQCHFSAHHGLGKFSGLIKMD